MVEQERSRKVEEPDSQIENQEEQKDEQSKSKGSKDRRMRDDELVINTSEQIEIVTSFD